MSHAKASSSSARESAVRCDGSGGKPETFHKGSGSGLCHECRQIVPVRKGALARHFIPRRDYGMDLRPAITGGAVDARATLSFAELADAWARAAGRITERHRSLSWLQKRGGRKGARTQQIRHDYQRLALESRIRVDELWPKAWRDRMAGLAQLTEQDKRVDLVIDNPVLVGLRGPSGGQDDDQGLVTDLVEEMLTPRCRICGCTDMMACTEGCGWVRPGLCTACVDHIRSYPVVVDDLLDELAGVMNDLLVIRCRLPRPSISGGAGDAPRGRHKRCERCGDPAPPIHGGTSLLHRLAALGDDNADVDIPVHGTGLVLQTRFCGGCIKGAESSKTLESYVAQVIKKRLRKAGVNPDEASEEQILDVIRQPRPEEVIEGGATDWDTPPFRTDPPVDVQVLGDGTLAVCLCRTLGHRLGANGCRNRPEFPSIKAFYAADERRRASGEADFGVWWVEEAGWPWPTWRVSYVQNTGEIYACEIVSASTRVKVLGVITPDSNGTWDDCNKRVRKYHDTLDRIMEGWAEQSYRPFSWIFDRLWTHENPGREGVE